MWSSRNLFNMFSRSVIYKAPSEIKVTECSGSRNQKRVIHKNIFSLYFDRVSILTLFLFCRPQTSCVFFYRSVLDPFLWVKFMSAYMVMFVLSRVPHQVELMNFFSWPWKVWRSRHVFSGSQNLMINDEGHSMAAFLLTTLKQELSGESGEENKRLQVTGLLPASGNRFATFAGVMQSAFVCWHIMKPQVRTGYAHVTPAVWTGSGSHLSHLPTVQESIQVSGLRSIRQRRIVPGFVVIGPQETGGRACAGEQIHIRWHICTFVSILLNVQITFSYHVAIHQEWSCTSHSTGRTTATLLSDWTPARCLIWLWQPLRRCCETCALQCCCSWPSPKRHTVSFILAGTLGGSAEFHLFICSFVVDNLCHQHIPAHCAGCWWCCCSCL